jgi:hypothetical protein
MQDDPRFTLATSSPDIDLETPEANIQAIINAVKAFKPLATTLSDRNTEPVVVLACSIFRN